MYSVLNRMILKEIYFIYKIDRNPGLRQGFGFKYDSD